MRRTLPTPLLLAALAALAATAATPADAAVKCRTHTVPGYVMVIDGRLIGEYGMDGTPSSPFEQPVLPPTEDILSIEVRCLDVRSGDGEAMVRRSAILVVTKPGAAALLTSTLRDLMAEQARHREASGAYAGSTTALRFFDSRTTVDLAITLTGDGWSATAAMAGLDVVCRVAVDSPVAGAAAEPTCASSSKAS
jgi:hypothetical protein